jgi:hypothetical protein
LLELSNSSPLSFTLELQDGRTVANVGDAAAYFTTLTEEQREASHWKIAIRMLNNALREPGYLRGYHVTPDGLAARSQPCVRSHVL